MFFIVFNVFLMSFQYFLAFQSRSLHVFRILFTSGAASVSFQVFGLLQSDYAALCFMMGFSCTLLGQYFIQRYLQAVERMSFSFLSFSQREFHFCVFI